MFFSDSGAVSPEIFISILDGCLATNFSELAILFFDFSNSYYRFEVNSKFVKKTGFFDIVRFISFFRCLFSKLVDVLENCESLKYEGTLIFYFSTKPSINSKAEKKEHETLIF
jgi:hypothetical protein